MCYIWKGRKVIEEVEAKLFFLILIYVENVGIYLFIYE